MTKTMNQILVFLLISGLLVAVNGYTTPGVRTAITNKGLNYALKVGIPILEKELSSIHIPDVSGSSHVVIGKIEYTLKNIHLSDLSFGPTSLTTKLSEGLLLSVSGVSLHATADWHYKLKTLFPISDSGSVDMSTSGVSLSLAVVISADSRGHATLSTKECSFQVNHLNVEFHGGASWLYNLFDGQIADAIKGSLNDQICQAASNAINKQGSKALESLPVTVKLDAVSAINYALTKSPNFTDWYMETDHKGEFFPVSSPHKEAHFQPSPLPPLNTITNITNCRMMYIWITDYVANTAALVYQRAGMLKYNITAAMIPKDVPIKLDTDTVAQVLGAPQLAAKYPNMDMQILLNVTKPPYVNITKNGANVTVPAEAVFHVVTKNGTLVPAFTIGINALLDGKAKLVEMGSNEVLVANATYIQAKFYVMYSEIGKLDVSNFQKQFNSLASGLIMQQLNAFLGKGLPLPTVEGISFDNAKISLGKGYALVETDVSYGPSFLL